MSTNRLPKFQFSFQGYLLVASPHWSSQLYGRSVCLVVQHSAEGAVGVFLNRNVQFDAQALWQHLGGPGPSKQASMVHFGGPQSGPVVAVHNRAELAEFTSGEGVYFAAQLQHLQQLVKKSVDDDEAQLKIIVGQADWSAGELEQQLFEGKWLPLPVSSKLVFCDGEEMWRRGLREVGNRFVCSITGAHGQPGDVLSN